MVSVLWGDFTSSSEWKVRSDSLVVVVTSPSQKECLLSGPPRNVPWLPYWLNISATVWQLERLRILYSVHWTVPGLAPSRSGGICHRLVRLHHNILYLPLCLLTSWTWLWWVFTATARPVNNWLDIQQLSSDLRPQTNKNGKVSFFTCLNCLVHHLILPVFSNTSLGSHFLKMLNLEQLVCARVGCQVKNLAWHESLPCSICLGWGGPGLHLLREGGREGVCENFFVNISETWAL